MDMALSRSVYVSFTLSVSLSLSLTHTHTHTVSLSLTLSAVVRDAGDDAPPWRLDARSA